MSVVNDIKNLINDSKLFIEADKLTKAKNMDNRRKKRSNKDMAKIGQGGTLDPLAGMFWKSPTYNIVDAPPFEDGVLGG
jgi:tRNA U55 pseudouridine synthase TruB